MNLTVAGLDLSLTATGVALIGGMGTTARCGTVKSTSIPNATLVQRHERIHRIVREIQQWVASVDLVVVEGPSYGSSSVGSWDRAWLYGAVVDSLLFANHRIAVAPPTVLKKFASGAGNADKSAVAASMARLWPEVAPRNNNEFDALALATMGAQWLELPVPTRAHHAEALTKVDWPKELR